METWRCRGKGRMGDGVGASRLPSGTHPHPSPSHSPPTPHPPPFSPLSRWGEPATWRCRGNGADGSPRASARPPPHNPATPCPYTPTSPFLPNDPLWLTPPPPPPASPAPAAPTTHY